MISQYPECFNAVEKFQGEYHIVLKPSLPPIVDPTRLVTISLKDDIKKKLDKKGHYSEDRKKVNRHNGSTALFTVANRTEG